MRSFDEKDLAVIGLIQEKRNLTPAQAQKSYRMYCLKLADADVENRADLVKARFESGSGSGAQPKAKKAPKAAKVAKPKAAKKEAKPAREETPKAELSREVALAGAGADAPHVYTSSLFQKGQHAIAWTERNRSAADKRYETVNLSQRRLDAAIAYGKEKGIPVAVAVSVRVTGKMDQGYVVPIEVFRKFEQGSNLGFGLSNEARAAYAQDGWAGCKISEAA